MRVGVAECVGVWSGGVADERRGVLGSSGPTGAGLGERCRDRRGCPWPWPDFAVCPGVTTGTPVSAGRRGCVAAACDGDRPGPVGMAAPPFPPPVAVVSGAGRGVTVANDSTIRVPAHTPAAMAATAATTPTHCRNRAAGPPRSRLRLSRTGR